jgi:hypothetical protein
MSENAGQEGHDGQQQQPEEKPGESASTSAAVDLTTATPTFTPLLESTTVILIAQNRETIRTALKILKKNTDAAIKTDEAIGLPVDRHHAQSRTCEALIDALRDQKELLLEGTPMGDAITAQTLKHADGHSLEANALGDFLRSMEIGADDQVISAWALPQRVEAYDYARKREAAMKDKRRKIPPRPAMIPAAWLPDLERQFALPSPDEPSAEERNAANAESSAANNASDDAERTEIPAEGGSAPETNDAPDTMIDGDTGSGRVVPIVPIVPESPAAPIEEEKPGTTRAPEGDPTASAPTGRWGVKPLEVGDGFEVVRRDAEGNVVDTFPRIFATWDEAERKAAKFNESRSGEQ